MKSGDLQKRNRDVKMPASDCRRVSLQCRDNTSQKVTIEDDGCASGFTTQELELERERERVVW